MLINSLFNIREDVSDFSKSKFRDNVSEIADGVYEMSEEDLTDSVWKMFNPPKDLLDSVRRMYGQ